VDDKVGGVSRVRIIAPSMACSYDRNLPGFQVQVTSGSSEYTFIFTYREVAEILGELWFALEESHTDDDD